MLFNAEKFTFTLHTTILENVNINCIASTSTVCLHVLSIPRLEVWLKCFFVTKHLFCN